MKGTRFLVIALALAIMLPASVPAASWSIDGSHSSIGFMIRHLGISKVRGEFKDFNGTIEFDEKDLSTGSVDITIQVASIDTQDEKRDEHLLSTDFFDAEKMPTMTFKSTSIEETEEGMVLHGVLSIYGKENAVAIPFEFFGAADDPWGGRRAGFEGKVTIKREDFGVGWAEMKYHPPMVGNDIDIRLNLELVLDK